MEVELIRLVGDDRTAAAEVIMQATNTEPVGLGGGQMVPATGSRIRLPAVWI